MGAPGGSTRWSSAATRRRAAPEFIAFWVRGGRVLAGMNANVWDVNEQIQELVRAGRPVELAALADPGVTLESLAGELAAGG